MVDSSLSQIPSRSWNLHPQEPSQEVGSYSSKDHHRPPPKDPTPRSGDVVLSSVFCLDVHHHPQKPSQGARNNSSSDRRPRPRARLPGGGGWGKGCGSYSNSDAWSFIRGRRSCSDCDCPPSCYRARHCVGRLGRNSESESGWQGGSKLSCYLLRWLGLHRTRCVSMRHFAIQI